MKRSIIIPLLVIILAGTMSGCSGGTVSSSWPGITVDKASETLYVAYQNHVYATQVSSGNLKWRFPEKKEGGKSFYTPPVLTDDGQLIVAGYDNKLYSVNPANGYLNWMYDKAHGRFIGSPLITDDGIYAPCSDDTLYALDLRGNPRWIFNGSKQALWATPALHGDVLYQSGMDRHLYAIQAKDGKMLWTAEFNGALVASPVVADDGMIYAGSLGKEMIALDQNGKQVWKLETNGWIWATPVINDNQLLFGDVSGTFYALNRTDGQVIWKNQPSESPITGKALVQNDKIFYSTQAGVLYAVDDKGNPVWNRTVGGKLNGDVVSFGNLLFVAPLENDSLVVAMDEAGNQQWSFIPPKD
jgi:outer membrane protein assembly factor BamB